MSKVLKKPAINKFDDLPITKKDLYEVVGGSEKGVRKDMKLMGDDIRKDMKSMEDGIRKDMKIDMEILRMEIKDSATETKKELLGAMEGMESRLMEVLVDFMGEKLKSEENRTVVSYQVSQVSDRVDNLEQRMEKVEKKMLSSS